MTKTETWNWWCIRYRNGPPRLGLVRRTERGLKQSYCASRSDGEAWSELLRKGYRAVKITVKEQA